MKVIISYIRHYRLRVQLLLAIALTVFGAYFFKNIGFDFYYFSLYNPLYSLTSSISNFTYSICYFILLFWVMFIFELQFIIKFKTEKNNKTEKKSRINNFLVPLVFSYLYRNYEIDKMQEIYQVGQLRKELTDNYSKVKFIESLRRIHNQVIGATRTKNDYIFKTVGLEKFIKYYLHTPNVEFKLFALKTIADFGLEGNTKYITKLLKSGNSVLRSAAIVALIKQNEENTLQFLVDRNIKLSEWDINQIISSVKNYKQIDYLRLINSDNKQVSTLGLRLAYIHNRTELKGAINEIFSAQRTHISEDLFIAFATFANTKNDFDTIFYKYELAPKRAQTAAIKAISNFPEKSMSVPFLEWLIESKPLTTKLEAMKQMLELDVATFSKYRNSTDINISNAYKQILDLNT
jgi:hypothetical protein